MRITEAVVKRLIEKYAGVCEWYVVTQITPELRIRRNYEGSVAPEATPAAIQTPTALAVDDVVWVQKKGTTLVVLGKKQ